MTQPIRKFVSRQRRDWFWAVRDDERVFVFPNLKEPRRNQWGWDEFGASIVCWRWQFRRITGINLKPDTPTKVRIRCEIVSPMIPVLKDYSKERKKK